MNTDLTFFTNEPENKLIDRFKSSLKDVQYFDILVGYFRTSGFFQLYESFENIDKIRILVGLNIDKQTFDIIETSKQNEIEELKNELKTLQDKNSDLLVENQELKTKQTELEKAYEEKLEILKKTKVDLYENS